MADNKVARFDVKDLRADTLKLNGAASGQAAAVANLAASTNITTVPASFADLAAVQTYLAGTNAVPNIEARLDAIEAKINALLASLRAAGLLASS